MNDQSDLIVKLADMATELRQLITEAHAATKDLRQSKADYERTVKTLIDTSVDEILETAVQKGLDEYTSSIKEAMDKAVEKVHQEFTKLADLYLQGPDKSQPGLEELMRKRMGG